MENEYLFQKENYEIVGAAIKVWLKMGFGFWEKIYENSLIVELRKRGFLCKQQKPFRVCYEGEVVGDYKADLVVNEAILLELKTAEAIVDIHVCQTLNYLKASGLRLGIILNFGPDGLSHKRVIL